QMQPAAERTEQDHLPVAELIARRLDDEGSVGRQNSASIELAQDVVAQVVGRLPFEEVIAFEPVETIGLIDALRQFAQEWTGGEAELVTSAGVLAAPEWHHRRRPLGRRHQDAIRLDLHQSPGTRSEQEGVADAALVDEFLIQFADTDAAGRVSEVLAGV